MVKYLLTTLLIIALTPHALFAQKTKSPNVIIIYMDDMGYGDIGSFGATQYQTPNLNRLAAQGMRFTNFYAAQPICSASRAALLTGCYPNRVGISGALSPWDPHALNPNEQTIAALLKKAGYHTGMIGKWHLGGKAPYLPLHYGFDEYLGLPYSNDMWPVGYDGKPVTDTSSYYYKCPPLPLYNGDSVVRRINNLQDQGELTTLYTKQAVKFITKNKNNPFFLYFAHAMVHVPLAVSPAFAGKSGAGLFGDVMMEIDWSVGQIMQTLKDNGLDKNTLVVFTSDNGPWLNFGNHAGSTGGLREGKATTFEGGQREPCIISMPGTIEAGTICSNIAANIDLLPTIANLCHTPMPANKIDGVDIWPLLTQTPGANPRNGLAFYYGRNNLEAVREGKWKYVFPHRSRTYKKDLPGRDGRPGNTTDVDVLEALYDLSKDPGETQNLAAMYPDVVKQMMAAADKYRAQLGDDLTHVPCSECRPTAVVK